MGLKGQASFNAKEFGILYKALKLVEEINNSINIIPKEGQRVAFAQVTPEFLADIKEVVDNL